MGNMKETGVPWIGKIPEEWTLSRVKYAFDRKKEKSTEKEPTVLSLARAGVRVRDISTNEGQLADSYEGYNPVEPGDLLLNPMDLVSGANCSISYVSGVISPAYMNLKAKEGIEPRYYDYFFKTQYWNMAMFAHGKGVSFDNRWTLNESALMDYYIPIPLYKTQERIADYLDSMCSKIDAIIDEAKSSVSEYYELRQSIIYDAINRGIDKNSELKDSGNSIIGKINKEYRIGKISELNDGLTDGTHGTYARLSTGELLLSSKNVQNAGLIIGNNESYISKEDSDAIISNGFPQKDDLLLCCIGGSIGRCILYPFDYPIAFQRSVIFIRCNKWMLPKMMMYNLHSPSSLIQEQMVVNASAQAGLYQGLVKQIYVVVPPIEEQKRIIDYLDNKTEQIDRVISEKEKLIDDMTRLKRSIIFEYVTGKKALE